MEHIESDGLRQDRKSAPSTPFPFARMAKRMDALDRLDLRFRWGNYGIHVLRCHLTDFPPGHVIVFHQHSEFEFHFIPKGKGKVTIFDRTYDLHEGLFYLTGPGVLHQQEVDVSDPMYELCLHCEIYPLETEDEGTPDGNVDFEAREARDCVAALQSVPAVPAMDRYNAMAWFLEAYKTWEEQPPGFYTTIKQAILQILMRAARVHSSGGAAQAIPERDMNDHRFKMATQFIEDNVARPITLEEVASWVGISPRQLQRIFQSEGQTTFRDWVEYVRLNRISAELLSSDRPIEEIALEHGYATPNYLYSVFKQKFGMTPSAYRRQHGHGNQAK